MGSRTAALQRQLFHYIAKHTRFDRASLPLGESRERTVEAKATWAFRVHFTIDESQHQGKLPADAIVAATRFELDKRSKEAWSMARTALQPRLEGWVFDEAETDAPLDAKDCLDRELTFAYGRELRVVSCKVTDRFHVDVDDANKEVVRRLSQPDLEKLREVAKTRQRKPQREWIGVTREYAVTCDVVEQELKVGTKSLLITAFGDEARVFDGRGIVSALLGSDLVELEDAVWRAPRALRKAAAQCLASPANVHIAAADSEAQRLTSKKIVTRDYAQRFVSALHATLARLYLSAVGVRMLIAIALPAAIFLFAHETDLRETIGGWTHATAFAIAMIAWALFESSARDRVARSFGETPRDVLRALLRKHASVRGVRTTVMILGVLLLVGVAIANPLRKRPNPMDMPPDFTDTAGLQGTHYIRPIIPNPAAVTCLYNATDREVSYQFRGNDDPWISRSLAARSQDILFGKPDLALSLRIDLGDERRVQTRQMATPIACSGARSYHIVATETGRELASAEPRGLIGITFTIGGSYPEITVVDPNSPAYFAGLQVGMHIREIDGQPTFGKTLDECGWMFEGPRGRAVQLEVMPPDSYDAKTYIVTRR